MFSLTTTATLHHTTPLPPSTTFSAAISKLQDHDLLIRLDPELHHYETLPPDPSLPHTKRYKVTDHMHTLPAGLWDTTVTFESEITNLEDGVKWVVKAPLGLRQVTRWRVIRGTQLEDKEGDGARRDERGDGDGEGGWYLVEDVEIKASRLLVGTVKGKCEENWRGVHGRFMEHLKGGEEETKS